MVALTPGHGEYGHGYVHNLQGMLSHKYEQNIAVVDYDCQIILSCSLKKESTFLHRKLEWETMSTVGLLTK